jgi:photosystem II stability/assembly factor-like uncharacterized protein
VKCIVWRWSLLGFLALALGCSQNSSHDPERFERPVVEKRLDPSVRILDLEVLPGGRTLAVCASSEEAWVSLSVDGGRTWKRVGPAADDGKKVWARALASSKSGLFLLTNVGVFASHDAGETWKSNVSVSKGTSQDLFGSSGSVLLGGRSGGMKSLGSGGELAEKSVVTALLELPSKTLLSATFGKGVFRSDDQGSSWKESSQGIATPDVTALAALSKGDVLAATFGSGVVRSSNQGSAWSASSEGLDDLEVQSLVATGGGRVLAGGLHGLFVSEDEGRSWKRQEGPLAKDNVNVLATDGAGTVLAGTWGNGLYRSSDRGSSWKFVDVRAAPPSVTAMSLQPDGPMYVGMESGEVFELNPEDGAWTARGKMDGSAVRQLLVAPDGTLYGATGRRLFRYDRAAGRWTNVPFAVPGGEVEGFVVTASGRMVTEAYGDDIAWEDRGVYVSTDLGRTWQRTDEDCLRSDRRMLTVDPTGTTIVHSCSCVSQDGGDTWHELHLNKSVQCKVAANGKHTVFVVSNNSSSAAAYTLEPGAVVRRRADVPGDPVCLAVLPDGTLAMSFHHSMMVLPAGKEEFEKRSEDKDFCWRLVGRADGSLVMLAGGGVHRSTDGGRTWKRIDGLKPEAEDGSPSEEGSN